MTAKIEAVTQAADLIRKAEKILLRVGAKIPAKKTMWARQSTEAYILRENKREIRKNAKNS